MVRVLVVPGRRLVRQLGVRRPDDDQDVGIVAVDQHVILIDVTSRLFGHDLPIGLIPEGCHEYSRLPFRSIPDADFQDEVVVVFLLEPDVVTILVKTRRQPSGQRLVCEGDSLSWYEQGFVEAGHLSPFLEVQHQSFCRPGRNDRQQLIRRIAWRPSV